MPAILVNRIAVYEAEHLLKMVWMLLERHQLSAPKIVTRSGSEELCVRLLFVSNRDAELVRDELLQLPVAIHLRDRMSLVSEARSLG
jgi:hypothetical protein